MSTIRIAARSWWKIALVAFAVALATVLPSTASAQSYYPGGSYYGNNPYINYGGYYGNPGYGGYQRYAPDNYRGYAYVTGGAVTLYGFRWTNYGWQRYQLAPGNYYVQPYSGKWRWVMTGQGWLIFSSQNAGILIG